MLLHAQIEGNKRRTWGLAAVFLALFIGVGASLGVLWFDNVWPGIVLALLIGGAYVALMTKAGTNVVMAMNRAREIKSEDDNPFLWNTVEALTIAARLPMPKVYIIDDPSPNAFAAGWSPKNSAVAVTTGLLERLNRQEIEGVLAHEVAHIQNYDVRLATTAIALVAVIGLLGDMARRMVWYGGGRRRSNRQGGRGEGAAQLIALLFLLLAPIAGVFVQMAISRNREYLADASGAELCRNPEALASALRKISAVPEPVRAASPTSAALYIADPLKKGFRQEQGGGEHEGAAGADGTVAARRRSRGGSAHWFSTHPPTEERIRRLEQMM